MLYVRFLTGACLLICLAGLRAAYAQPFPDRQAVHILNRLAFGPTLEDFHRVKAIGVDRYLAEQLAPESIPEPFELGWRLAAFDTLKYNAVQLRQLYGPLPSIRGFKLPPELIKAREERARAIVREAAQARLLRAVLSQRQLQEVMVDFWFNHFNIFAGKELDDLWIGDYERRAIRPFVLGRFRDLLFAATKHPAMLVYLDNTLSTSPTSPGGRNSKVGLNENFAREVMELHTLGADGGYSEEDVVTLARVLTGWRVNRPDSREFPENAAVFEGARHDFSPKAGRFQATGGDIREVLKVLFTSGEFWESYGQKYKTPYHFVISATRAAGVPVNNTRPLLTAISQLGMPLFGCLTPDGYKNTEAAWLNPDATTQRISFATVLARGALPLASLPPDPARGASDTPLPLRTSPVDAARLEQIFGSTLSGPTREAIAEAPQALRAALILGSPDFMRR